MHGRHQKHRQRASSVRIRHLLRAWESSLNFRLAGSPGVDLLPHFVVDSSRAAADSRVCQIHGERRRRRRLGGGGGYKCRWLWACGRRTRTRRGERGGGRCCLWQQQQRTAEAAAVRRRRRRATIPELENILTKFTGEMGRKRRIGYVIRVECAPRHHHFMGTAITVSCVSTTSSVASLFGRRRRRRRRSKEFIYALHSALRGGLRNSS